MTLTVDTTIAPRYRPYRIEVRRTERLSPTFLRVTLHVDDPGGLGCCGYDQRVKLVLPAAGTSLSDVPRGEDWFARVRAMPDDRRPVLRTYTVRRSRPHLDELDVDVVLHGDPGPAAGVASTWAATARPGDEALLVGPDTTGRGRAWGVEWDPPPDAGRLVIAGDETAVPAAAAILESLTEAGPPVLALLEVPLPDDRLACHAPPRVEVRWLVRDDRPHGTLLRQWLPDALGRVGGAGAATHDHRDAGEDGPDLLWDVVGTGDVPGGASYLWLAGEAGLLRDLRRRLRGAGALPVPAMTVMGYWRRGAAGP